MKQEDVKGNWKDLQCKLKQRYPVLTDNDLAYKEGKEQDMLKMVAYKLRKTKEELSGILVKL